MHGESRDIHIMKDAHRSSIEVHIRGTSPGEHRVIRLARLEARRLAALILYQAERLGPGRRRPAGGDVEVGVRSRTA